MPKRLTGLAAPMVIADLAAFSSALPAAIAALLVSAAGGVMGVAVPTAALGLAAAGTLFVYNVDRLRDLGADRETAPARTAFVERHRAPLRGLAGIAALAGTGCAALLPRSVWILCGGVLGLGLLHRRLKQNTPWKPVYVAAAWIAVTAWLPALSQTTPVPGRVAWVTAVYAAALGANVLGSTLRGTGRTGGHPRLQGARVCAALGVVLAVLGPSEIIPLVAIPLAVLASLIRFHPAERYSLIVVDGALLLGAALAWLFVPAGG